MKDRDFLPFSQIQGTLGGAALVAAAAWVLLSPAPVAARLILLAASAAAVALQSTRLIWIVAATGIVADWNLSTYGWQARDAVSLNEFLAALAWLLFTAFAYRSRELGGPSWADWWSRARTPRAAPGGAEQQPGAMAGGSWKPHDPVLGPAAAAAGNAAGRGTDFPAVVRLVPLDALPLRLVLVMILGWIILRLAPVSALERNPLELRAAAFRAVLFAWCLSLPALLIATLLAALRWRQLTAAQARVFVFRSLLRELAGDRRTLRRAFRTGTREP